ncbi:MAG: phenylacetate--CoA ligase family protein [Burkholderiales bacterium]
MQFQLEQSQWWLAKTLQAHQLAQLKMLLVHAYETVPFYRERFQSCDFDPVGDFSLEDFCRLPVLTRTDIQKLGKALLSSRVPPDHGRLIEDKTSGSTATPIHFYKTEVTLLLWHALTLRDHLWHKRDLSGKLASIRRLEENVTNAGWGPSTDAVFHTGPAAGLKIETDVRDQIDWLRVQNPDYLLSFPSNLQALAKHCLAHGVSLPKLHETLSVGEVVTPDLRKLCFEAWHAPLVDVYSTAEVGYIALQCPRHEHYHVQSESVVVEILDADGQPCAPGTVGKVVITPLHNFAMPFIRYEIGDYAEPGGHCTCGRGLPVLNRILGRVRNMMTLPSGEQHWPTMGIGSYGKIAPIRQCQIVQKSLENIAVNLVAERSLTLEEEQRLREFIVSKLGHPFQIDFTYHSEIAREASGKFEDFRSEIAR